jgi:hypothetical protein
VSLVKLPIRKPTYNVEPHGKTLPIDSAKDCYYERADQASPYVLRRRPGYSLFCDPAVDELIVDGMVRTGQGIFWSDRFESVFIVTGGRLFRLSSAGVATEITGSSLNIGRYVVFAEGQNLDTTPFIYIAHGGVLRYTDGVSLLTPSDINVPTVATFVVWMNGRAWADNGEQDFWITDTNPDTGLLDPFYWSLVDNPWRATMKSDILKALWAAWNEVSIWGTRSIEYWQEDGVNHISPLVGATTEAGTLAPHSIVQASETLFALAEMNGKRAVVRVENRSPKIISEPIDAELQKLNTISDAVGALMFTGGINVYVLNFPTENKTWVYDLKEDMWLEWGKWNHGLARYDDFPVAGSCFAKGWNKHLFLSRDGKVYITSREVFQDAGSDIRTSIRTGWINHGTYYRKRSDRLIIKLKTYAPTASNILLRWRNDGRSEWSPHESLAVGSELAETQFVELTQMGSYRSRQYEFVMTANADMALCGVMEEVEVLTS